MSYEIARGCAKVLPEKGSQWLKIGQLDYQENVINTKDCTASDVFRSLGS